MTFKDNSQQQNLQLFPLVKLLLFFIKTILLTKSIGHVCKMCVSSTEDDKLFVYSCALLFVNSDLYLMSAGGLHNLPHHTIPGWQ